MSMEKKDPLRQMDERITKLEQGQDALLKSVAGIDGYFKDPQGLTKQIQDTMLATVPGIIQNEFAEYDKSAQARFATRGDVRQSTQASGEASTKGNNIGGVVENLVKTVTDVLQKMPSGARIDPNYSEYLAVRDGMMSRALSGLGRGIGRGVEREVTKHVVAFD